MKAARLSFDLAKLRQNICALQEVLITFSIIHTSCLFVLIGLVSITIPSPPRCSDHRRSLCPVCGSATAAIIPRWNTARSSLCSPLH